MNFQYLLWGCQVMWYFVTEFFPISGDIGEFLRHVNYKSMDLSRIEKYIANKQKRSFFASVQSTMSNSCA